MAAVGSIGGIPALPGRAAGAADPLYILPGDSLDRLRLDFNASRSKVRLLVLLSPT